ncbi:hypothetical protein [Mycolicibacterium komossense]|uniref:Peptidase C39 domain-containing protein n=1 Tax=Mycolicibacterium komossense TaxID=1779 RepID=A0ABT3C8K9_9MYCO|nr:hypothetical protein [Mycolicibacterium komossense]MCV7225799.1 hypothetical protein [Mycolicibacterium komossense]
MELPPIPLRQHDGVSCGPSVAIVAGALLDPGYRSELSTAGWFAAEQGQVHRAMRRIWPRFLGMTPTAMARAISGHSGGMRYRWRLVRRHDRLLDVREAVLLGWPVPMLVGRFIPRHWVLLVGVAGTQAFQCYEPSSGEVRTVAADAIRVARLTGVGFPRPVAFVLPARGR